MRVYYDQDADLSLIQSKKVTVLGYGSQGHAHAHNLAESKVDVTVGLRPDSANAERARAGGLKVASIADAVSSADVVMMLIPDELQADVYREQVAPNMRSGAALAFAHGFNIHFGLIEPRADIDVFMIAPKGPGHLVRSTYQQGSGVPCLIALQQDLSGPGARPGAELRLGHRRRALGRHRDHLQRRNRNRPLRRASRALRRLVGVGRSWL